MGIIKAGVVVVNKYCKPDSKIFSGYIKYMDREEAVRTEHVAEFDMFNEYMGNPEKTTGLFTAQNRRLSEVEIMSLKKKFETAQDNGSYMWQTVISFDNLWLEQFGLYDAKSKILYEDKIKELAINGIQKMLHNEKLDHAVWSAAIHFNTDNIHVHVATVEEEPMREKKLYRQFSYKANEKNRLVRDGMVVDLNGNSVLKEEMKGKFDKRSFELCKQYIVNEVIKEQDFNRDINELIRNKMARSIRGSEALKDQILTAQMLELRKSMPDCNRNLWNYNNNIMLPYHEKIDQISNGFLERNYSEEFKRLKDMVRQQSKMYHTAYGDSTYGRNYEESKMQDLYSRMGNSILKTIRNIEELDMKNFGYEKNGFEDGKQMRGIQKNVVNPYEVTSKQGEKYRRIQFLKLSLGMNAKNIKVQKNWEFDKAMRSLKKSFQKDFETWKNILEYDAMLEKTMKSKQEVEI